MSWIPKLPPNGHRYLVIADAIERAIQCGDLRAGTSLPTHRELAWQLGLDTSTITQAYVEASKRHLIQGKVGQGTFVLGQSSAIDMFNSRAQTIGLIDLSINSPTPLPEFDFAQVAQDILRTKTAAIHGYPTSDLFHRFREAGVKWLAMRGISALPNEIVPVAGGQAGLAAIMDVLKIHSLSVEEATYSGVLALARLRGVVTTDLPIDADGLEPTALEKAKLDAAIIVPTLHNPTGLISSMQRRQDLLSAADRSGVLLIEDDAYGPLTDTLPMAVLDSKAQIVLVSTLSKCLAPGLRIGFIYGQGAVIDTLNAAPYLTSWSITPLMMEITIKLIQNGQVVDWIAAQRVEMTERFRIATQYFPQLAFTPVAPHVIIPTKIDALEFETNGVRVASASAFSRSP